MARYKASVALSRKGKGRVLGRGRVLDKGRVSDKVKDSGKVRRRVVPKASELKTSKIQSRHSSRSKSTPARAQKKSPAMRGFCTFKFSTNYTLNEEPQPQVLFTFGLSNLSPAPSRVSM